MRRPNSYYCKKTKMKQHLDDKVLKLIRKFSSLQAERKLTIIRRLQTVLESGASCGGIDDVGIGKLVENEGRDAWRNLLLALLYSLCEFSLRTCVSVG